MLYLVYTIFIKYSIVLHCIYIYIQLFIISTLVYQLYSPVQSSFDVHVSSSIVLYCTYNIYYMYYMYIQVFITLYIVSITLTPLSSF